ncbi:MAG: hypothetical protein EOP06_16035 [Proteobacteria bacterium]|nr:MAG: hypothetical protein EOP06_16035 [Pseudomonadota bacterium]
METIQLNDYVEAVYPELSTLMNVKVFETMKGFFKVTEDDVKLDRNTPPDQFVYGAQVVELMYSAPDLKAVIKIHYSPSETYDILGMVRHDPKLPKIENLNKVFAEFGNQLAGNLKAGFTDMGYIGGISLPVPASAYDEMISSDILVKGRLYSYCGIEIKGTIKIVLTITIQNEGQGLKDYVYSEKVVQEEDEFL